MKGPLILAEENEDSKQAMVQRSLMNMSRNNVEYLELKHSGIYSFYCQSNPPLNCSQRKFKLRAHHSASGVVLLPSTKLFSGETVTCDYADPSTTLGRHWLEVKIYGADNEYKLINRHKVLFFSSRPSTYNLTCTASLKYPIQSITLQDSFEVFVDIPLRIQYWQLPRCLQFGRPIKCEVQGHNMAREHMNTVWSTDAKHVSSYQNRLYLKQLPDISRYLEARLARQRETHTATCTIHLPPTLGGYLKHTHHFTLCHEDLVTFTPDRFYLQRPSELICSANAEEVGLRNPRLSTWDDKGECLKEPRKIANYSTSESPNTFETTELYSSEQKTFRNSASLRIPIWPKRSCKYSFCCELEFIRTNEFSIICTNFTLAESIGKLKLKHEGPFINRPIECSYIDSTILMPGLTLEIESDYSLKPISSNFVLLGSSKIEIYRRFDSVLVRTDK
ncbi:unnamed protein product [Protopolystoma xenopodis]|uniref:Uncharacterized protein n=1 Tax=Protopolystoma xenopodis TaxID=117903 RepID=A0A448XKL8_9PLAT|nr:unnamed protein product [Protopolystoma xenopodis]